MSDYPYPNNISKRLKDLAIYYEFEGQTNFELEKDCHPVHVTYKNPYEHYSGPAWVPTRINEACTIKFMMCMQIV